MNGSELNSLSSILTKKKLWKIRTGPLGHRGPRAAGPWWAVVGRGPWAAGPSGRRAAGPWRAVGRGPLGRGPAFSKTPNGQLVST